MIETEERLTKAAGTGRERLLKSAQQCFAKAGFEGVGVAQILEGAGVQAPTLYHHFGDKEGLYVAWATSALGGLEPLFAPLADPNIPIKQALQEYAAILLRQLGFDLRLMLRDAERLAKSESREAVANAYLQSVYNPLCVILVRGVARNELRQEPIGAMAETYIAGSLAAGRYGWRSTDPAGSAAVWWARTFLQGCGAKSGV